MYRYVIAVVSLGFLAVCATTSSGEGGSALPSGPTESRQQIKNVAHFDVGTCFATPPTLTTPVAKESVLALQVSARPLVMECLVNPANRGAAPVTKVSLETTFAEGAFTHKVTSDNLTADGEKCILDAANQYSQGALPAASAEKKTKTPAEPVTSSFDYQHDVNQDPSVVMGINELSDLVGSIRVANPSWCDCFESVKESVPAPIPVKVTLKKGVADADAGTASISVEAEVDQSLVGDGGTAVDTTLSQCLIGKLKAHPFEMKSEQDIFPYFFIFTNFEARGDQPLEDPNIRVTQLELQRAQRTADRLIAFAQMNEAASSYTALVNQYKAKPASVTRTQLINRCAGMIKGQEGYVESLRGLKAVTDLQLSTLQELKTLDPQYPPAAEEHATKQVAENTADLQEQEKLLASNKAACARLAK